MPTKRQLKKSSAAMADGRLQYTMYMLSCQILTYPHPLDSKYRDLSNEIRLNLVKYKRLTLWGIHLVGISIKIFYRPPYPVSCSLAIRSLAGVW